MTERETLPQSAIVPASDYVIIGGTGDLSLRKIFPALFLRYASGQVTNDFRLFVVGRKEVDANEFREKLEPHCISSMLEPDNAAGLIDRFMKLVEFACIDISQPESMAGLAKTLLQWKAKTARSSSICRLRHRCLVPHASVFTKLVLFCHKAACVEKAARS